MKKELYSGKVHMGTCGEPTGLYDSFGNELMVGDLVSIYEKEYVREINVVDPEYVVCPNGNGEDGTPFVMGLKSCKRNTHYFNDGEEVTREDGYEFAEDTYDSMEHPGYKWLVRKVKDWSRTVDGEAWGGVTVRTSG